MVETLAKAKVTAKENLANYKDGVFVDPELIKSFETRINKFAPGVEQLNYLRKKFQEKNFTGQAVVKLSEEDYADFGDNFELDKLVNIELENSQSDTPKQLKTRIDGILSDPNLSQIEKQAKFHALSLNRNITDQDPKRFNLDNLLGRSIKTFTEIKRKPNFTKVEIKILLELNKKYPEQRFLLKLSQLQRYSQPHLKQDILIS